MSIFWTTWCMQSRTPGEVSVLHSTTHPTDKKLNRWKSLTAWVDILSISSNIQQALSAKNTKTSVCSKLNSSLTDVLIFCKNNLLDDIKRLQLGWSIEFYFLVEILLECIPKIYSRKIEMSICCVFVNNLRTEHLWEREYLWITIQQQLKNYNDLLLNFRKAFSIMHRQF